MSMQKYEMYIHMYLPCLIGLHISIPCACEGTALIGASMDQTLIS